MFFIKSPLEKFDCMVYWKNAENIKNLPSMLSILMDEYEKAKKASKSGTRRNDTYL